MREETTRLTALDALVDEIELKRGKEGRESREWTDEDEKKHPRNEDGMWSSGTAARPKKDSDKPKSDKKPVKKDDEIDASAAIESRLDRVRASAEQVANAFDALLVSREKPGGGVSGLDKKPDKGGGSGGAGGGSGDGKGGAGKGGASTAADDATDPATAGDEGTVEAQVEDALATGLAGDDAAMTAALDAELQAIADELGVADLMSEDGEWQSGSIKDGEDVDGAFDIYEDGSYSVNRDALRAYVTQHGTEGVRGLLRDKLTAFKEQFGPKPTEHVGVARREKRMDMQPTEFMRLIKTMVADGRVQDAVVLYDAHFEELADELEVKDRLRIRATMIEVKAVAETLAELEAKHDHGNVSEVASDADHEHAEHDDEDFEHKDAEAEHTCHNECPMSDDEDCEECDTCKACDAEHGPVERKDDKRDYAKEQEEDGDDLCEHCGQRLSNVGPDEEKDADLDFKHGGGSHDQRTHGNWSSRRSPVASTSGRGAKKPAGDGGKKPAASGGKKPSKPEFDPSDQPDGGMSVHRGGEPMRPMRGSAADVRINGGTAKYGNGTRGVRLGHIDEVIKNAKKGDKIEVWVAGKAGKGSADGRDVVLNDGKTQSIVRKRGTVLQTGKDGDNYELFFQDDAGNKHKLSSNPISQLTQPAREISLTVAKPPKA